MKIFKAIIYAILLLIWVVSFASIVPIGIIFFMDLDSDWIEFGKDVLTNLKNI